MIEIKNKARSSRGVHDASGRLHMLAPGETKIISVSPAALALLKKKGSFLIYEKGPALVIPGISSENIYSGKAIVEPVKNTELDESTVLTENTADETELLRGDLESLGVKVDRRWKADRLRLEIDKALEGADAVHSPDSDGV